MNNETIATLNPNTAQSMSFDSLGLRPELLSAIAA